MSFIALGPKLRVRADEYATQVVAALGMRGSGKSNVIAVGVEGLLAARIPVVVLDYVGIWYALRLKPDGKTKSRFDIPVLGGAHGDIGLEPTAGRVVAESLARSASSAILDLSDFTKFNRSKFLADFGEAFFHTKKSHRSPVQLVLEEAQRIIPQKIIHAEPHISRMLGAFEEIAETGRNFGIGLAMISLRPEKLNKDVLNLAELLCSFQMTGVHERKRVQEWVQEKDQKGRDQVYGELPSLKVGEALVWSPRWLGVYGKHRFHKKSTYDAGATPTRAAKSVKIAPLKLDELERSMAEVVEQAKENDPRELKRRIRELERDLAKKNPAARVETKTIEVPGPIPDEVPQRIFEIRRLANEIGVAAQAAADRIYRHQKQKPKSVKTVKTQPVHALPTAHAPAVRPTNGVNLKAGCYKIINAIASSPGCTRTAQQVATLTGIKVTGTTMANYKSLLKTGGYIETRGNEWSLTEAGRRLANTEAVPTDHNSLLTFWRPKLKKGAYDLLDHIVRQVGPGKSIERDEWAVVVDINPEGTTLANYISILVTNGLVSRLSSREFTPAEVWE